MISEEKTCAKCAYWNPQSQICVLFNAHRADTDYCSCFNTSPAVCATCGSYIIKHSFYTESPKGLIEVCASCAQALSTCAGCKYNTCEFEQNPDPMPKMVMQQVRQGNAIMQASVKNPERIKKFCIDCKCWDTEECACNKEFNTCGRYDCILNP